MISGLIDRIGYHEFRGALLGTQTALLTGVILGISLYDGQELNKDLLINGCILTSLSMLVNLTSTAAIKTFATMTGARSIHWDIPKYGAVASGITLGTLFLQETDFTTSAIRAYAQYFLGCTMGYFTQRNLTLKDVEKITTVILISQLIDRIGVKLYPSSEGVDLLSLVWKQESNTWF